MQVHSTTKCIQRSSDAQSGSQRLKTLTMDRKRSVNEGEGDHNCHSYPDKTATPSPTLPAVCIVQRRMLVHPHEYPRMTLQLGVISRRECDISHKECSCHFSQNSTVKTHCSSSLVSFWGLPPRFRAILSTAEGSDNTSSKRRATSTVTSSRPCSPKSYKTCFSLLTFHPAKLCCGKILRHLQSKQ